MHRLTARALLILLLVSVFAPAALAVSQPPQHACCLRQMHCHASGETAFQVRQLCSNNCCPPVVTAQWAAPASPIEANGSSASATFHLDLQPIHRSIGLTASHPGRAPPQFSIA